MPTDRRAESVRRHAALALGVSLLALAGGAAAQTVNAEKTVAAQAKAEEKQANRAELADIIVTANRASAQSLQNIPMAITAVDPRKLERSGLQSLQDLTRQVPSLNIQEQAPGINKIDMRGLTTGGIVTSDVQDRALVAIYLDDAAISLQGQNPDLKVIDLERIEVIRGPQGTLYGAGSMSGTIRYITQKPDVEKIFGSAEGILSKTDHAGGANYNLRGMINYPLIKDKLAVRGVFYYGKQAGWIDNVGAVNRQDSNSATTTQARIALRWLATDTLTVDASWTYGRLSTDGLNNGFAGLPDYTYSSNGPEFNKDRLNLFNLTLNNDFGWGDMVSSTTFTSRKLNYQLSPDPTIAYFFESYPPYLVGPNPQPPVYTQSATNKLPWEQYIINNNIMDFQQELRFASKQDQRFRWNAGIFYQYQERSYWQDIPVPGFDTLSYQNAFYAPFVTNHGTFPLYNSQTVDGAFSANDVFSGTQDSSEYQIAGFAEGTFDITNKLSVTLGGRYFYWNQQFNLYFGGVYGVDPGNHEPLLVNNSISADGFNPKATINYQVDPDVLLFAEAAKGFRYGGVNQPVPKEFCAADLAAAGVTDPPQTFGPDSLWSYQVGIKSRFADRRVTLNATAFLINWDDVQTRLLLGQCSYYFIQNAGKVQSKGLELEANARVTDAITLSASGSYTNATANGPITNLRARDGDQAPYFPEWIAAIGANYDAPAGPGILHLAASFQYRSETTNQFNPTLPTYRVTPSQSTLNASINYEIGRWEVGIFGTNLTNGTKVTSINPKPGYIGNWQAGDYLTYAIPATIGMRVHYAF